MQDVPHSVPNGTLHLVTGLVSAFTYSTVACHGMPEPQPDRVVSYDLAKPNPWSTDFVLHWSRLHTSKEAAIFPRAVMTQGLQLALSPNLWAGRFRSTDILGRPCYQVPRPASPQKSGWRSLLHRRQNCEDVKPYHGVTVGPVQRKCHIELTRHAAAMHALPFPVASVVREGNPTLRSHNVVFYSHLPRTHTLVLSSLTTVCGFHWSKE